MQDADGIITLPGAPNCCCTSGETLDDCDFLHAVVASPVRGVYRPADRDLHDVTLASRSRTFVRPPQSWDLPRLVRWWEDVPAGSAPAGGWRQSSLSVHRREAELWRAGLIFTNNSRFASRTTRVDLILNAARKN